jgi:hypothetical protein
MQHKLAYNGGYRCRYGRGGSAGFFSVFLLTGAATDITLYTGCGTVSAEGWKETADGSFEYVSEEGTDSFPTPAVGDATLKFAGWYSDEDYKTAVNAPSGGGTYYAKWERTAAAAHGDHMDYTFRSVSGNLYYPQEGIDAQGQGTNGALSTTRDDMGYCVYYKLADGSASGEGTLLGAALSGDPFIRVNDGLYVAQTASFEGNFVRYTYYIWNRGETDVSNFNLGAEAAGTLPIKFGQDSAGSYAGMQGEKYACRLYYAGSQVTPADTVWAGEFWDEGPQGWEEVKHVFDDKRQDVLQNDPSIALSWKNISISANGVVTKSFLLGCGTPGSLMPDRHFSYDSDGDGKFNHTESLGDDVDFVTAPEAPAAAQVKKGFYFLGWNTKADGSGIMYQPGAAIDAADSSVELYSQWQQIGNTVNVSLTCDDKAWSAQKVQLFQDKVCRYTLKETSEAGRYQAAGVINGTYEVYVNGRKSDQTVAVESTDRAVTAAAAAAYFSISVTTTLDKVPSSRPGQVTLRRDGSIVYVLTGTDGVYTDVLQESEGNYQIYVGGMDSGHTISSDKEKSKVTIDYLTAQVRITDDTPWTDAKVTLRDQTSGKLTAVFNYTETTSENTAVYEDYIASDEAAAYEVYVNGKDTHKSITQTGSGYTADIAFYTATATIEGNIPSPSVNMANGSENISFTVMDGSAANVYTAQHVLIAEDQSGQEKPYTISVKNTIDTLNTTVTSKTKTVTMKFWVVKAYVCNSATDPAQGKLYSTSYVRDTCVMPALSPAGEQTGYSFTCWSETEWTKGASSGEAFDFTEAITRDVNLYSNFSKPALTIGELVYTDEEGNAGGSGAHYRMANLRIEGFDAGNSAIRYAFLSFQGTADSVKLLSTDGVSVQNGGSQVSAGTFAPKDPVVITFSQAVSMAAAQDYLRSKIVVTPKANVQSNIRVEVMDGSSYTPAAAITPISSSGTMTDIAGGTRTLENGNYWVSKDLTIDQSATPGANALQVKSGCTAYLYIPTGVTLTVNGGNGSGSTGGGAAIYVPYTASLYVFGGGTLNAQGGKAGNGGNGENGKPGSYQEINPDKESSERIRTIYSLTAGGAGAGGNGGGGAGAGIGGNGGSGGAGGAGTDDVKKVNNNFPGFFDDNDERNRFDYPLLGSSNISNGGQGGNAGINAGKINVADSVKGTIRGGDSGSCGKDGSNVNSIAFELYISTDWVHCYVAESGGAGGYGAGGGKADPIGAGGYGGGGGGSGTPGACGYSLLDNKNSKQPEGIISIMDGSWKRIIHQSIKISSATHGNNGGHGGGMNGTSEISLTNGTGYDAYYEDYWMCKSGDGAAHGSAGTIQEKGTKDVSGEFTTISYDVASSATATVHPAAVNYEISHADLTTVTIPSYADSDADVRFYGWQVSVYASSSTTGAPLTSGSERYYGGETFTLAQSTMGRITLKAVTEKLGGVHAADTASMTYTGSQPKLTYHTYQVKVLMDGTQTAQKGTILIGQTAVAPGSDGTYTLVDQDDSGREVKIGGQSAGTVKADAEADISYETLKVTVTGLVPSDVCLGGDGAPELTNASSGQNILYMTDRLAQAGDHGSYDIYVDGRKIPGITASYGTPAAVVYHTITAAVTSNGTVANAELHDAAGGVLPMKLSNGSYTCTELAGNTVYTLYINGEATGQSADFSKDQTLQAAFNRYTTNITTQLDGVPTDMGRVKLGDERMIRTGTGRYMLITQDKSEASLTVDGKVTGSVTPGNSKTVDYYSITYLPTDGAEGIVPEDRSCYLSGTKATLLSGQGLLKGGQAFSGWMVDGVQHQPGDSIAMTSKVTATACWSQTDISSVSGFTLKLAAADFTYNGTPGIPELTLARDGSPLQKGRDYTVAYQNTNTANGHSDAQGSEENAINAGTVTVTVSGTGDYKGQLTASYQIAKAPLTAAGLVAADREYNGTMTVQIGTDDATLSGIIGSDDVRLQSAAGRLTSADAGEGKTVRISNALLTGAAVSEYTLEPVEPVKVNIAKKPLTQGMFSLAAAPVQYNAAAQTPQVTAHDMGQVAGKNADLITSADYSCTYADNIHAGTAAVLIHAGRPVKDAGGNVTYTTDGNYSGSVTVNFTITPAPVTLSATSAESAYGAAVADVSGNYDVTAGQIFTEEDKTALAIKGITTVKAGYDVGTYTGAVQVSYDKDSDYDVTTVPAVYTVTPADTLKVTSAGYAGVYDGAAHSITVTPQPYRTDEKIDVYYSQTKTLNASNYKTSGSMTKPAFTDAGNYTVYFYACSDNYKGTAGSNTVTIGKAPLTVSANAHTITYGQDAAGIAENDYSSITVSGLKGNDTADKVLSGPVSYTSNDYVKYEDTGTYTLMPKGLSASNYDISYQSGKLTVGPKPVTFTWPTAEYKYNGSTQEIEPTVNDLVNGDTVTALCSGNAAVNAGNYTAKVESLTGVKAGNYTFKTADTGVTKEWTINKARNSWLIQPSIQGWTAGEKANAPVAQAKYGELSDIKYTYKASNAADDKYSATVPETAGTYYVKATVPATDNYGTLESAQVEFMIATKTEQTKSTFYATVVSQSITYGEKVADVTVNYTDADGNAVDTSKLGTLSEKLIYTTYYDSTDTARNDAGTYVLKAYGQTSDTCNIVYVPGTLTVEPKEVSLTWSDNELGYNGSIQTVSAQVAGTINSDTVSVSDYSGNIGKAVGSYTASAKALGGADAGNYKLPAAASHDWKIVKAANAFVITPFMNGWTYGETASTPIGTAKYGTVTFKYQEVRSGITDWTIFNPVTKQVPTAAGTYKIIAEVAAGDGYNALTSSTTEFTIAKAEATVTAADAASEYGQAIKNPLTYSTAVFKGKLTSDDITALKVTLATEAAAGKSAGSYPITVGYTSNDNINVSTVNGNYTITKAALKVEVKPVSAVYDGKAHGIAASVITASGNAVTDAEIHYSTSSLTSQNYGSAPTVSPTLTNVGSETVYYYITGDNYTPLTGNVSLAVTKKPVTVTAKDTTVTYGEAGKNDGATYSGFEGSDTAESLNLKPDYKYTYKGQAGSAYAAGSPVGTYDIVPGNLTAGNYSFDYKAGTMTVTKKALTDSMFSVADTEFTYDGAEHKPTVTGTDGTNLLKTSDYTVTYTENIHAGTDTAKATIKALDTGNYLGTVTKTFTIKPREITYTAESATSVYNAELAPLKFSMTKGSAVNGYDFEAKAVTTVKKGYAAGTYTDAVSVSYKADSDYAVKVETADYTVTKASLTVAAVSCNAVYDGAEHKPAVTAKTGKFLTFAKIYYSADNTVNDQNYKTMTADMPSFKTVGMHRVYFYAVCESDDSFKPVGGTVDVVITKAPLTVTAPDRAMTYGDAPDAILAALGQADLTFSGFVNNEKAADAIKEGKSPVFATAYKKYGAAGVYDITPSGLESDNYALTYVPGKLTVNKKYASFTWPADTALSYNGLEQGIDAAVTKVQSTDDVTAVCEGNRETAVGEYTAKVTGLAGASAGNYTVSENEATAAQNWKINKAANSFTIEPSISDWTEGKTAATPIAAAKYGTVVFTYASSQNGLYTSAVPTAKGEYYLKAAVAGGAKLR